MFIFWGRARCTCHWYMCACTIEDACGESWLHPKECCCTKKEFQTKQQKRKRFFPFMGMQTNTILGFSGNSCCLHWATCLHSGELSNASKKGKHDNFDCGFLFSFSFCASLWSEFLRCLPTLALANNRPRAPGFPKCSQIL